MTRPSLREIGKLEFSMSPCLRVPLDILWLTRTGLILESRNKDATICIRSLWLRVEPVCCLQVRTWSPKGLMHILQEQSVQLWSWASILGMGAPKLLQKKTFQTSGGKRVTDFCWESSDRKPTGFQFKCKCLALALGTFVFNGWGWGAGKSSRSTQVLLAVIMIYFRCGIFHGENRRQD